MTLGIDRLGIKNRYLKHFLDSTWDLLAFFIAIMTLAFIIESMSEHVDNIIGRAVIASFIGLHTVFPLCFVAIWIVEKRGYAASGWLQVIALFRHRVSQLKGADLALFLLEITVALVVAAAAIVCPIHVDHAMALVILLLLLPSPMGILLHKVLLLLTVEFPSTRCHELWEPSRSN